MAKLYIHLLHQVWLSPENIYSQFFERGACVLPFFKKLYRTAQILFWSWRGRIGFFSRGTNFVKIFWTVKKLGSWGKFAVCWIRDTVHLVTRSKNVKLPPKLQPWLDPKWTRDIRKQNWLIFFTWLSHMRPPLRSSKCQSPTIVFVIQSS